ncbi:HTH domain-containing protein [Weissella confusa]|uniref:HTH domain-containing protein n=1 Tax=Weissella confusa TaxID=1583 RepID=UPI0018F177DD|nr:HTH domain-containing protein [Weissella confusa]MBJ7650356.1 HTH domain-containing protein [Weissella confusa]MBJ7662245.1 HTH domain-containing protein [Weissella confusa]
MSEETLTDQLEQLVAMLPEGAEQPVSISEIATRLNTNKRTITAWVAFLINHKGVPIGSRRSAPSGYYLITSDGERNNAIAPLTAQALEELKRAEKLRSIDLHTWRNNFNDNKKSSHRGSIEHA